MAKSDSSKIAVRPRQKSIQTSSLDTIKGIGDTFLHSEATRSTEEDALARPAHIPRLNELQQHVATLERIGRDPKNYMPDFPVRDRPMRAIYGSALWSWIGRQPGITMTSKEVEKCLDAISGIQEARADMGLDSE